MATAVKGCDKMLRAWMSESVAISVESSRNLESEPEPLLRPIERIGINEQILSRLKAFLEQKHLKVGSRLPSERKLAELLRVSRPSIREVLRGLAILGIVKSKQGDGTYLATSLHRVLNLPDQILTLQEGLDLVELAEARSAVEPVVASLAATRASRDDLLQIHKHFEEMKRSVKDRFQFLRHDLEFHLAITRACGNEVLKRMMFVVLERLFERSQEVARHYSDMENIWRLHEEIYRALDQRDPQAAKAAMIRHMKVSKVESTPLSKETLSQRPRSTR